jgi:hypothetical protein
MSVVNLNDYKNKQYIETYKSQVINIVKNSKSTIHNNTSKTMQVQVLSAVITELCRLLIKSKYFYDVRGALKYFVNKALSKEGLDEI